MAGTHARRPSASALVWMGMLIVSAAASGGELGPEDFVFDGPLGSAGARIEKLGPDHFRVRLGHAPKHRTWANKLQFEVPRGAKGHRLVLDVTFDPPGGKAHYLFDEYFHCWSYDGRTWHPVRWRDEGKKENGLRNRLEFPRFTEDRVVVGHQVPMSAEDVGRFVNAWRAGPLVEVTVLGRSLGGRDLYRVTITDPASPHPPPRRWVHYFANQHPGEHNSQWRMVGMVRWLLSDAAEDARKRSICHFILMMGPDAPSKGWYRVNAQGVDMNRSYRVEGADQDEQAHEAYLCQKDLEGLMASEAPPVDVWSMHTWPGKVDPILYPGPEVGTAVGPWTDLRDILARRDEAGLFDRLRARKTLENLTYWTGGPHRQFGVTAVLCEGAGALHTKEENLASGETLMAAIAEYYAGLRPAGTARSE